MMEARWRIFPDVPALAAAAAEKIVAAIAAGGAYPAVCLTGGATPRALYALLGEERWAQRIPWRRTHWFVGDERFVPESDARSNLGEARRLFLDRWAPRENIHLLRLDAADVHAAARAYETELVGFHALRREAGATTLFDLVLLGVGTDGHVASIFPGSAAATERQRWVVGVDQPGLAPLVPRITLTFSALSSCREQVFMVSGRDKAPIVEAIARGAECPASKVTSEAGAEWLVDRAAAPPDDAMGPRLLLVMGVSGAGKTTIGREAARRLAWSFLDADDFHSDANKAKMRAGAPLTDDDRAPWLAAISQELARRRAQALDVVVACSALKRHYRDVITGAFARRRIVYLRGAPALIAARLETRKGHFMPPALLDDQLNVLEEPDADESALIVDVEGGVEAEVERVLSGSSAFIRAGRRRE